MLRDTAYLIDILESARIAIDYLRGKSLDDFQKDVQCQDAVIRRLEIIGEAARRISRESREVYPNLPWSDMVKMRNFMIHEYDSVDMNIVYETVLNDLPLIVAALEIILK